VPLSSNGQARARQLANLKPSGALQHGAHSEALTRPLAETYFAELRAELPSASERVLRIQARRLAKLDRLATFLEQTGEIRHKRRGEVYPASALEERVAAAFLAEHVRLEDMQRTTGATDAEALLAAVVAEITAAREDSHDDGA
jgi:CRP-like cAMP-binding protein